MIIEEGQSHDQLPTVDQVLVEVNRNNNFHYKRIFRRILFFCTFLIIFIAVFFAGIQFGTQKKSNSSSTSASDSNSVHVKNNAPDIEIDSKKDSSREYITANDLITKGIALNNGHEFLDETSYQSHALKILNDYGVIKNATKQKLSQRYALLCLYYSTFRVRTDVTDQQFGYGTTPGWNNALKPWKFAWDDDECTWYGIACDTNNLVTKVELQDHLLTGYIPIELKLLNTGPISIIDFTDNRGLGQGGFPPVFSQFNYLGKFLFSMILKINLTTNPCHRCSWTSGV